MAFVHLNGVCSDLSLLHFLMAQAEVVVMLTFCLVCSLETNTCT